MWNEYKVEALLGEDIQAWYYKKMTSCNERGKIKITVLLLRKGRIRYTKRINRFEGRALSYTIASHRHGITRAIFPLFCATPVAVATNG